MRTFNYKELVGAVWDSETLALVSQIHEFKGRQELFLKQKAFELKKLVTIAKVQGVEASNKIEGIVTTSTRIKQLVAEKTMPKSRDEEEIMGYRDVLNTIHESYEYIPLTSTHILQLHRDLYSYSEKAIGGRFKNTQNYISETTADGREFVRFMPLEPYETPGAIEAICDSYVKVIDACEVDPLILIPVFINDFLCIHPFNDGNGRMSRLLTTLLLYKSGYLVGKYISLEKKIESTKQDYYDALAQSNDGRKEGKNNALPFIKYLLRIVLSAYRDFESRVDLVSDKKPSAFEMVKVAIDEHLGKFTKSKLIELCPAISKASIENALKKLVETDYITRHGNGKNTFYVKN